MKHQNHQQLDLLCAEFVLGTLHGPARRRFESLVGERGDIRQRLADWDARLNVLAEETQPVAPTPAVWEAIAHRIDATARRPHPLDSAPNRVPFWRSIALVSTFTSVVLAFLLIWPSKEPSEDPGYVVMLRDQAESPIWVINTTARVDRLLIKATSQTQVPEGKRCYLWLQPAGSTEAHRLGVLPDSGEATVRVSAELSRMMPARLLVSIEDENAPPARAPGEVIEIRDEWLAPVTSQI